ncbi:MAG: ComEC/Rec2 family competence protein, partial [Candidatus Nanopelagicales bacterium]
MTAWFTPLLPTQAVIAVSALCVAVAIGQRRRAIVVVTCLVAAATAGSMAIRTGLLEHGPVAQFAREHRTVDLVGTLTGDPRWSERTGFGGTSDRGVSVEVRVQQVSTAQQQWDVRTPILVIGDAAGWDDLRFGMTIKLSGSLREPQSVGPVAAVLFARGPPLLVAEAAPPLQGAEQMRVGLRDAVADTSPDVRGLLPALVVGDTTELSSSLVSDLRTSGLAHLTAVSGANVAIVLMCVLLLARFIRVRGYALPVVGLVTVAWFVLLARPQPSVLRAAVMGALAVVAVVASGQRHGPRLLLAAVLLLLFVDPWLARSWGFALSAAATAGLLTLAGRWADSLSRRMPRPLADGAAVALAAQVATLPLAVALSGQIALLAVPANLLAAPAVAPATALGAAAAAVSPVSPWLAQILAWCAQWPTAWIAFVAHRTASSSIATLPWPDGGLGAFVAVSALAAVFALLAVARRRHWLRARYVWIASLLAVIVTVAYANGPGKWPPSDWILVVCDVGQGDALVVSLGQSAALVVDAGPDPVLVDQCLDRLGVRYIPLLVLTHDHADHVNGVPGVLEGRKVDTVMVSPLNEPIEQADLVDQWTTGLEQVTAAVGQSGDLGLAHWQVLWPARIIRGEGSDPNNASVVLLVEIDGIRILLTGDVEPAAQRALASAETDLSADVFKVPHHGSRYQDPQFWREVSPDVALVS